MKQVAGRLAALFALLLLVTAFTVAQTAPAPAQDQSSGQAATAGQTTHPPQGQRTPNSANTPDQTTANPNGQPSGNGAAAANGANGASGADTGSTAPATSQDANPQNNPGATQNTAGSSLPWLWIGIGIAVVILLLIVALSGRGRTATTIIDRNDRINDGPIVDRTDRTARIDRERVIMDRDVDRDRDDIRRAG